MDIEEQKALEKYYFSQAGGGLYQGQLYQRGYGIGSILG